MMILLLQLKVKQKLFLSLLVVIIALQVPSNAFLTLTPNRNYYQYDYTYRTNTAKTTPTTTTTTTTTTTSTALNEQAKPFASTGPRQVDMNQYNLPSIDQIQSQWIANVVAKTTDTEGGIFLGVENNRELFVDEITTASIPRPGPKEDESSSSSSPSLGIGLLELAGGRDDGVGITIVSEVIKGGLVDKANVDIQPGDSITSISIIRPNESSISSTGILADTQETISIQTECLNYDMTVHAILNLVPPPQSNDEQYIFTLKRIRRKPIINITLQYPPSDSKPDDNITLYAGENLRLGMLVRGIKINDPLAKRFDTKNGGNCGAGGLCRTCALKIVRGGELLNPQKVAEEQMLQDTPRWRLGCKAFVGFGMKEGDLTVQVNPRQW